MVALRIPLVIGRIRIWGDEVLDVDVIAGTTLVTTGKEVDR